MTTSSVDAARVDAVNKDVWTDVVDEFATAGSVVNVDGWSDPGELAAISAIADEVRGEPILDIGVGGGRTTTLLRLLSDHYVGVDYTPEMVSACRRNHPGADIRLADARDLAEFADAGTQLVVFSYNGLDAVGHDDRARALSEIARVLRPGGLLQFSTLNLAGPCFRATPWHQAGSQLSPSWSRLYRVGFAAVQAAKAPALLPRTIRNYRNRLRDRVVGEDWAVAPFEAHGFRLLVHYVTLAGARRELAAAGLTLERAFDAEHGRPLSAGQDLSGVRYFQLVARRTGTPAA